MTRSNSDMDNVIMTNAYEESRLAEVLADYCRQHPEVGESDAQQLLMKRLSDLVSERRIGIYEAEIGRAYRSSEEYRDLPAEKALAVILNSDNWAWAPLDEARVMHYLFAIDNGGDAPKAA